MNIMLGYVGCALAACVILLEYRAVRRLMADTKRMDSVFGPLGTPGGAELPTPRIDVEPDIRHSSEVQGDRGT